MKTKFKYLGITVLMLMILLSCFQEKKEKVTYHCPMHPTVVSDREGDCPICGMKLVPLEERQKEVSENLDKDSLGTDIGSFETYGELKKSSITITPQQAKLMNLTYGIVEKKQLLKRLRVPGVIVEDEKRIFKVNTKVDGWIEKLYANTTGKFVTKGEPLLSIYSPELFAAQQEFLSALSIAKKLPFSSDKNVSEIGKSLYESAKKKLLLQDISSKQIEEIEKSENFKKSLIINSPVNGYIIEKDVFEGEKIVEGETLLTIADLSVVWALGDLYEPDIPFVKEGMEASVVVSYLKETSLKGRVNFVYPFLDQKTRTVKVRVELKNPKLLLKPDTYCDIYFSFNLGEKIVVPENAVLRSGENNYAFIAEDEYSLKPVKIELGLRNEEFYEVLSGLKEGDKVVTSANFLIDSESSLKYALDVLSKKNDKKDY